MFGKQFCTQVAVISQSCIPLGIGFVFYVHSCRARCVFADNHPDLFQKRKSAPCGLYSDLGFSDA